MLYSFLRRSWQAPFWCRIVWRMLDLGDEGCASSPSFSYSSMANSSLSSSPPPSSRWCTMSFFFFSRACVDQRGTIFLGWSRLSRRVGNLRARVKGCATNDRAWILRSYARFVQANMLLRASLSLYPSWILYTTREHDEIWRYMNFAVHTYAK